MSTVTVASLIARAETILQDTTNVRWPQAELVGWLNDAYREITLIRPDANSRSGSFSCAAGTRQVLTTSFATALRLIDVVRCVVSGRAVRQINRAVLDDQRRAWHAEGQTAAIEHFMFDARLPLEFLVYPPALAGTALEVVYSLSPESHNEATDYTGSATVINLPDNYANVILDYILYRAYSKDADYAANAQRAVAHYQAMQQALGVKTQSDGAVTPQPTPRENMTVRAA